MQPTVFVVDDDSGALQSLAYLLRSAGHLAVTFPSAEKFLDSYNADWLGCLVCDYRMPGLNGTELLEQLVARQIELPAIMISGYGDVPVCARAFRAGALDFLEKPFDDRLLLSLVERGIQRHIALRAPARVLAARFALSSREADVLGLILAGHTAKQIAVQLGISGQTVAKHRSRILAKCGVSNDVELALAATSALNRRS